MKSCRLPAILLTSLALGLAACDTPAPGGTGDGSTGMDSGELPGTGSGSQTTGMTTDSSTTGATTDTPTTGDPDTGDTEGPADTGGTDDPATGDSSGGEEACDTGFTCASAVPEGWNGPVALIETEGSEGPAACEGSYSEFAFNANAALNAPPAVCECSCGDAVGADCPDEVILAHSDDDGVCTEDGDTTQTVGIACQPQALADSGGHWRVVQPEVEGGSCSPSSEVTLPATSWGTTVTGCALPEAPGDLGCAGEEICVPEPEAPAEANVCIWAEGDQECPAAFADRTVFYDDVIDDRGCSECSCGDPVGTCTEPEVRLHPNSSCACVSSNACNVGTTCEELGFDGVLSMDLRVPPELDGTASCAAADVGPTGAVTPIGGTTVCCAS